MSLIKFAESEMQRAGLFAPDSKYDGAIAPAVMKLVEAHEAEGHSGESHALTLAVFNRVINFKPLSPITSSPSEWMQICSAGDCEPTGLWQSTRQSSVFSRDGGKTWFDTDAPPVGLRVRRFFRRAWYLLVGLLS